jgi:acyl-coenzyme A synthetase/AMP-(fatty) acid ligase
MPDDRHANAIIISAVALLAALASAVFAGWQAWEARQARQDAQKAATLQAADVERSRAAAEKSANAAQALANSAQATLQNSIAAFQEEQRPWLDVSNPHVQEGGLFHADVINHGRTPAYNITSSCRVFELRVEGIVEVQRYPNQQNGNLSVNGTKSIGVFVSSLQRNSKSPGAEIACDVHYRDAANNRNRLSYCYAVLGLPPTPSIVDCNVRSYISK